MFEPPLVIPFLPDVHVGGALPVAPVAIAAWSTGTITRLALAGDDNSVWIVPASTSWQADVIPPPLGLTIPVPSHGNGSGGAKSASPGRWSQSQGAQSRPRTMSNASSIISCSSRGGKRMFSPTSSSVTLAPAPALSSVAAEPEPPDTHAPSNSNRSRAELVDSLKLQVEDDDRSNLGLGLAGLTRRGLNVHGKEELEGNSPRDRETVSAGSMSSESTGFAPGHTRARTLSRLSGFWTNREGDEQASRATREHILSEMEVEKEMAREAAEGAKEAEDFETVKRAKAATPIPTTLQQDPITRQQSQIPIRIVLPAPDRGSIVHLAAFEEAGVLVALRDVGLLDVIVLADLALTHHVDLGTAGLREDGKRFHLAPLWTWRRVQLATREEGTLVVAHGVPTPTNGPSPNGEVTRVVMLALPSLDCAATLDLPGIGDVGVASSGEASYLLHATPMSIMSYRIIFPSSSPPTRETTPRPPKSPSSRPPKSPLSQPSVPLLHVPTRSPAATNSHHLESSLARFLGTRRIVTRKPDPAPHVPQSGVDGGVECHRDGGGHWLAIRLHDNGQGIGVADGHVEAFEFDGTKLEVRGTIPITDAVRDVTFTSGWHDVVLVTDTESQVLGRDERRNSGQTWHNRKTYSAHSAHIATGTLYGVETDAVTSVDLGPLERQVEAELVRPVTGEHICPLGADIIFAADEGGNMRQQPLANYLCHLPQDNGLSADRADSPVTCSTTVESEYAVGGRFLIAGAEDGSVRIWDARPFRLCGSWTLFDDPVRSATPLHMEQAGKLRDGVLLTSSRGSVAVVSLRDMEEMFLLPAARAQLERIFVGGEDIMLAYANGKARVWNVETREFRRSTGFDSAEDMLDSGWWAEVQFAEQNFVDCPVAKATGAVPVGSDLGRLLQLDLRRLGRWLHRQGDDGPLPALRGLLSVFLTFGINPGIDEVCTSTLGISPPAMAAAIGLEGIHQTVEVAYTTPAAAWRVSPTVTGLRQLAIVTLLRPFLDSPEYERAAADVIAYYTACLPEDALEAQLELFAAFYLDSSSDVHQAARMLFSARLSRMSNDCIAALVADQQNLLPAVAPQELKMSETAARALTMIGGMALQRFECMTPSSLKAVAESISLYLHDPSTTHVTLAIELCSKGFSTWQTYLDPMSVLRRLFYLSTHKDNSGANIAAVARLAVLHVANSNAPLFMSTLSMDILDAKSLEGRTAIMKLCVFMARKRPALLENGLPRICEAVVKSLDPNAGKMRDDVWEAATVILNELVQAFTTIDFHSGTQKLAVGTHEGAVIMYDLKSASRLYVLEAHKGPVSAVAFSPDGRRLVTVSLVDHTVTVWKVGSSLSGFFNVGGPPRQGGKPGEPYKRIPFVRPNAGELPGTRAVDIHPNEDTGALSDAIIQWRGNRQALVTIKETALNFETT